MILKELKPKQALNKAFLKLKLTRAEIDGFKTNLVALLDRTNHTESEEFHKNLVSDFLKDTYYKQNHFINTKGRNDLVIHNGQNANSNVGVIIETKKPTNKTEMLTRDNLNKKAFHELILYYLRERITHKNLEIKHLVATNIYEWFIFDATLFDRLFAQNKTLLQQFQDFENGRLADTKTDFFYEQIAEPFIDSITSEIHFTYFNIEDYQKALQNTDNTDDNSLIALFKLFSPEHLLKLPFANDSNTLDKKFYNELLYIIGLTEISEDGRKLIQRNKAGERHTGTILEDAIIQLDSLDKLSRLEKPHQFGNTKEQRLFNVALELSITWINRILFLKLLEAQLLTYHKGDKSYSFLNIQKIKNYHQLNTLFFQVLARQYEERNDDVKKEFEKVPYLNSSLFEPTELEHATIFISNLKDDKTIPIFSQTVLKDQQGKKRTGNLNTLQYLFEFLDAYDFGAEGGEEIQEDNKTLINASVLGLIFEKINGYKDGSFFTPGFITMYMCRETIRKAVVQKFAQNFPDYQIGKIEDIYELIPQKISKKKANEIINSIKICDPAVGSGHFLVSALNEMIAVKNDLGILLDFEGKPLKDYWVGVANDELFTIDKETGEEFYYLTPTPRTERTIRYIFGGDTFKYTSNKLPHRQVVQQSIFKEKQTIIENCLFGVDINPNSVKICRLRLWIELLKNAYYTPESNFTKLETLPNIDINIKCGNSLVSRFPIDADLSKALKKINGKNGNGGKWTIDTYRLAVATYRNAQDKEQKREMERLIADIKADFNAEIYKNDPKVVKKRKLKGEIFNLTYQTNVFEQSEKDKIEKAQKVELLQKEIEKLNAEIEAMKANKIFENAFEWRFEFPEVLNDDGDFVGFDVVIGNPPYIQLQAMKEVSEQLKAFNYQTYDKMGDIYSLFYEKGNQILKNEGFLAYITSNKWLRAGYGKSTRNYFLEHTQPVLLIDIGSGVFAEATVDANILIFQKKPYAQAFQALDVSKEKDVEDLNQYKDRFLSISPQKDESWTIATPLELSIKRKIEQKGKPLKEWDITINYGIKTGYNKAFIIDGKKKDELIAQDPKSAEIIKPILRGRDIKRYKAEFADWWIIATFPSLKLNIDNYPAVKAYLESFGKRLHQTGETFIDEYGQKVSTRKKTGNKWFETQDQISYYKEFEKEKIVYSEIVRNSQFFYDTKGYYVEATAFFLTNSNIKYLVAFLNSKLLTWAFKMFYSGGGLGDEGFRYKKMFLLDLPIPVISTSQQVYFADAVNQILARKEKDEDTTDLENQIDQMVYELYGLTEEEIKIIESN